MYWARTLVTRIAALLKNTSWSSLDGKIFSTQKVLLSGKHGESGKSLCDHELHSSWIDVMIQLVHLSSSLRASHVYPNCRQQVCMLVVMVGLRFVVFLHQLMMMLNVYYSLMYCCSTHCQKPNSMKVPERLENILVVHQNRHLYH